jgi:hypothetical protein
MFHTKARRCRRSPGYATTGTHLMNTSVDATIGGPWEIGPLERLGRFVLIAYLSPVILVVLAIGLVGIIATKMRKPITSVTVEDIHSARETNRQVGLATCVAQVCEVI